MQRRVRLVLDAIGLALDAIGLALDAIRLVLCMVCLVLNIVRRPPSSLRLTLSAGRFSKLVQFWETT